MLLREKMGVCQWFHYEAYDDVFRAVAEMHALGIKHLRTGISWADFHRPGGKAWYDWQMRQLRDFDVLLSVWHTPPSIAEGATCASPPRRLEDYADFIGQVIEKYGECFSTLELWNEPNNRMKWDFERFDPHWQKFGEMIHGAARVARARRVPTVLGGMIPVDHHWLELMGSYAALTDIDVIAIHAFPGMWWTNAPNWDWCSHWQGWEEKVRCIEPAAAGRPIWVTETGLATWDLDSAEEAYFDRQVECLLDAAAAPAERLYWYSLIDLSPEREAIEGFHVDENEYHMGLVTWDGRRKPAWYAMAELMANERLEAARALDVDSLSAT